MPQYYYLLDTLVITYTQRMRTRKTQTKRVVHLIAIMARVSTTLEQNLIPYTNIGWLELQLAENLVCSQLWTNPHIQTPVRLGCPLP